MLQTRTNSLCLCPDTFESLLKKGAASSEPEETKTAQQEEQSALQKAMAQRNQPNVDSRVKTDDVTGTKGLTFKDFGLCDEVQFVSLATKRPKPPCDQQQL